MSFSLNEVEALAKRAARGSGLHWGLAEEAAKGVRWLARFGLPGPALLADLLILNDGAAHEDLTPSDLDGVWTAPAGRLSPLIAGAALSDCADQLRHGSLRLGPVSQPMLLAPFAAAAARYLGQGVALRWAGTTLLGDGTVLEISGDQAGATAELVEHVECALADPPAKALTSVERAEVDGQTWARLGVFAARTYAPATEASRLLGAGAGVSDND
ncbi:MAG: DUF3726 domain-containing protein [Pseudomonadota bacterium]